MNALAQIDPTTTTLGQLARRYPSATRVFDRFRLDYCCGGDRHLAIACADIGVSVADLLVEVLREHNLDRGEAVDWETCPLADICRHIVHRYHEPLRQELPALRMLSVRVATVHGETDPRLMELATLIGEVADEMDAHMQKEERVLFPAISSGPDPFASRPIACMRREHTEHGERLARIAVLTDDFNAPEHGCASWHALCERLRDLDRDLKAHINLENNVLFPRAMEALARLNASTKAL